MKTHPIAWMIRPDGASMFDERAIEIRIEDQAAGPFVVVKLQHDDVKPGEISIEPGEWPTLRAAIDAAVKAANEIEKDQNETRDESSAVIHDGIDAPSDRRQAGPSC